MPEADHISIGDPVGALFSTDASDNAEVVPPHVAAGPETMWSTDANAVQVEDPVDGELLDEADDHGASGPRTGGPGAAPRARRHGASGPGASGASGPGASSSRPNGGPAAPHPDPRTGGVFSAEPVERPVDVVDEDHAAADIDLERAADGAEAGMRSAGSTMRPRTPNGAPLFSSARAAATGADPWDRTHEAAGEPRKGAPSPFTSVSTGTTPPATRPPTPNGHVGPANGHAGPPNGHAGPPTGLYDRVTPPQPPPAPPHGGPGLHGHLDTEGPDPNGLRAAVSRLHPLEAERTAVPIAVVGALLHDEEQVLGAVTGQMLGRPAVVVVTDRRVLVVNDRRWQPIVDEFRIDSSLVVRGRHDRNVAALSFADPTRLAMVDNITEVGLAVDLAEKIRDVGST